MRRLSLVLSVLVAVCSLSGVAFSQEPEPGEGHSRLVIPTLTDPSSIFQENDLYTISRRVPPDLATLFDPRPTPFHMDTFFFEREPKDKDEGKVRPRLSWSLNADFADSRIKLFGEAEKPHDLAKPEAMNLAENSRNQVFLMDLNQAWGMFKYGLAYRRIGDAIDDPEELRDFKKSNQLQEKLRSDQEGGGIWAQWNFGPTRLKVFTSEFWDNVEGKRDYTRTTKTQSGGKVSFKLPVEDLFFSLSYLRGSAETSWVPNDSEPRSESLEKYGASLYYQGGPTWNVNFSSSYSSTQDMLRGGRETARLSYWLGGSYYPTRGVYISPSLGFSESNYRWSGERYESLYASLEVYGPLVGGLDYSAYGSWTRDRSSDGFTDAASIYAGSKLTWKLRNSPLGKMTLSFGAEYSAYIDTIYPSGSYEEFSGSIRLNLTLGRR